MIKKYFLALMVLLGLVLGGTMPSLAATTTFVVDNNHDGSGGDSNPGNCICEHGDDQAYGLCPLRAAIEEANACASETIVIIFDASVTLYTLLSDLPEITNTTGAITIDGNGAVIDGNRLADNGFRVFQTAGGTNVTIKNVTIQNAYATTIGGSAIYNMGTLTLEDAILDSNRVAQDLNGGAIYNEATMVITGTTISNNAIVSCSASGTPKGNGVFTSVNLTIENSTLSNNGISGGDGACALGGAIASDGHETYVVVVNSTLSGNFAKKGSGVYANSSDIGEVSLKSVTVAQNGNGEGSTLHVEGTSNLTLQNTLVSANTSSGDAASVSPDCYGTTFLSLGNNLISSVLETCLFPADATDIFVSDAGLEALTDNGGATKTHALRSDSAAINVGSASVTDSNNVVLTLDQIGQSRISGGVGDIGAFEYQFTDADADGYFADATSTTVPSTVDCDDAAVGVFPGASETCGDGIDQNCDGVDDACPTEETNGTTDNGSGTEDSTGDSASDNATGMDVTSDGVTSDNTTSGDATVTTDAGSSSDAASSDESSAEIVSDEASDAVSDDATVEDSASATDEISEEDDAEEDGTTVEDDGIDEIDSGVAVDDGSDGLSDTPDGVDDGTVASSASTTSSGGGGCQLNPTATAASHGLGAFVVVGLGLLVALRRRVKMQEDIL